MLELRVRDELRVYQGKGVLYAPDDGLHGCRARQHMHPTRSAPDNLGYGQQISDHVREDINAGGADFFAEYANNSRAHRDGRHTGA